MNLFEALTGYDEQPATVNVAGVDYAINTDFREWCLFDSRLFDQKYSDEDRLTMALTCLFAPADFYDEMDLSSGEYPFDLTEAFTALLDFWLGGRHIDGGKRGGRVATERPYDFVHDVAMIYAAFKQAYNIDLTVGEDETPMHWWTFYALFSNLPEGSVFASAKAARISVPAEYPKHLQKNQAELKAAWALPDNIRYYKKGPGAAMTESEFLAHINQRREEAQRAIQGPK